jgi:hypothetical protein
MEESPPVHDDPEPGLPTNQSLATLFDGWAVSAEGEVDNEKSG